MLVKPNVTLEILKITFKYVVDLTQNRCRHPCLIYPRLVGVVIYRIINYRINPEQTLILVEMWLGKG